MFFLYDFILSDIICIQCTRTYLWRESLHQGLLVIPNYYSHHLAQFAMIPKFQINVPNTIAGKTASHVVDIIFPKDLKGFGLPRNRNA